MAIISKFDKKSKNGSSKKNDKKSKKQSSPNESMSEYDSFYDDDDDDSDYVEDSDEEETESDYETLDSDDTDDDDDDDDDSDEDEMKNFIIEDDDEENENTKMTPKKIRKTVSKLFPSKYMKDRVKEDTKHDKSRKENHKKHINSKKHNIKTKKMSKKRDDDEDEEEYKKSSKKQKRSNRKIKKNEESDEDSDDDDDDDDEDDDETNQNINIIFGFGPGGQMGDEEQMKDEHALLDEEDVDSDEEQTFMKETYQKIDLPENVCLNTPNKGKKHTKQKSKRKSEEKVEEETKEDTLAITGFKSKFESEYSDLNDMKKYLAERLQKNPRSKTLFKSLKECNRSIKKLVKKERGNNTKQYHKMISGQERKFTSEIDYFKKKLSNQEQHQIMKDLKQINQHIQIDKPYRLSLLESKIPNKYKATVLQKLNILRTMEPGDPEYYKMKNWIDTFMRVPIGIYKSLSVNMSDGTEVCQDFMEKSIQTLDSCVYGLNDAKMQIIQMVGQWMTNPNSMGTAIAIHGPPGTGKTSLTKDGISKILGREFAFIALGGAGDSSFLEGHSYTYEGSSWGKILQILIDSKCMNPVIYFDELDKLSDSPRGVEIASILTHLTDTSQNSEFHDKYFSEMSFDLSKCLFIFSYNDESKVSPILRDRMYRIMTKGYNTKEKINIAKNYMLPKIREQVNFDEGMVIIPDDTLEYIITKPSFTKKEDGVRNLKRCLEIVHTKLNLFRLIKPDNDLFSKEIKLDVTFPFTVTRKDADLLIKEDEPENQSMLAMYV